ncbi:MAG: XRE family transcriptional regulator [Oscillospiraceae bacterium]|jgi:transcriptional regulator with XRE-family HTH domain|nr:XRE family transcriptional regulator [Oscillospiraceae bacterium]
MSRLGDLLKLERTRRGLTPKQVAKLCGVAEKYLIDVESGSRIIADDQARRILKRIGLEHQNEADFSLDDIAAVTDLAAAKQPPTAQPRPTPDPQRPVISLKAEGDGGIFLSALAEVLHQVPVYDAGWNIVDTRLLPIIGGRIEGGAPDKTLYFRAPDASCRGFRILPGDLALITPAQSPIDGAIMLVVFNNHRALRKVKIIDEKRVMLQTYDREYEAENAPIESVAFIGRAVRIEIYL